MQVEANNRKRIFFLGEINVDIIMGGLESLPIVDREISAKTFELTIGSSTAICACAYVSLGGNTSFIGLAGQDEYGDFMVNGMQKFGINTDAVCRTSEVGTGVTVNLNYGTTRTQVTYPGTISEFNREHIDFAVLETADHIHLGGPFLQARFLPDISDVLAFARRHGISTSLDPQWDTTEEWEHLAGWLPQLDYFFPNKDEAVSITGEADPYEACRKLAERTAFPVVKIGREGVICNTPEGITESAGFEVDVVDTTGAGDSFDAGLLYALLEKKMVLKDALRFANGVAARSCTFAGGVNARSSYEDVLKFLGDL